MYMVEARNGGSSYQFHVGISDNCKSEHESVERASWKIERREN